MEQVFQLDKQKRKLLEHLLSDTEYLYNMHSEKGAARQSMNNIEDEGIKAKSIASCNKMAREYNKMCEVLKAILYNTDTNMTITRNWQNEQEVPLIVYRRCIRESIARVEEYKKVIQPQQLELEICNAQIELLKELLLHRKDER